MANSSTERATKKRDEMKALGLPGMTVYGDDKAKAEQKVSELRAIKRANKLRSEDKRTNK